MKLVKGRTVNQTIFSPCLAHAVILEADISEISDTFQKLTFHLEPSDCVE